MYTVRFASRRYMLAQYLLSSCVRPSVCLSLRPFVRYCVDTTAEVTSYRAGFRMDAFFHPTLCYIANLGISKNITSNTKPEVHNMSQCCQKWTEPRPQATCAENLLKFGRADPEMLAETLQRDRLTGPQRRLSRYSAVISMD